METVTISDARRFSLQEVQRRDLLSADGLQLELVCFEAGQRAEEASYGGASVYQVLEGEALVRAEGESYRLGKGKLLSVAAGQPHLLENAGGGLLVVLATRAR